MKTAIVIPARYASSRLPGKPLLRATGKYLIQHVYERARAARGGSRVLVATDDARIEAAVRSFGGDAVMTRPDHPSGTDRVAEVARHLDADVVINLQGDEPLIDPADLELLVRLLQENSKADMATLAIPIRTMAQWQNPNCVKVVCDNQGKARYFSRAPIPYVRDRQPDFRAEPARFLQHLGIYAYRRSCLLSLAALPPSPLEELEKLEQLRALAHGRTIQVGIIDHAAAGVDTPEDYDRFVRVYRQAEALNAA